MRNLPGKRNLSGIVLAVMAAGGMALPAAAAQSSTQPSAAHRSTAAAKATHPGGSTSGKKSTGSKSSSRKRSKKVKGQSAPAPDRISEIQEALARKGATDATPTGKWDDSTSEALKRFQSTNGLASTGKLDALTLQKLGLGSETAGLAAPKPPPNSVNRLRNNTSSAAEPTDSDAEPRN
jgi:peptidoglycan hydrolase-like protein with peptidoglycan-binding domain